MTAGAERLKAECLVSRQGHSGTDAFHGERATAFRDATMCHASACRSSLAVPMGIRVETDWAVSGARECRVPFRPMGSVAGQSLPSRTIPRGCVDLNRPTAASELAWRPKFTSLKTLGRGQGSTDECRLGGRRCGGGRFGCSAGHSSWFIVLNAHAKRGQCPTTIDDPCGGLFPSFVVRCIWAGLDAATHPSISGRELSTERRRST